jgi:flagellar protein FliO/FliZ
MRQTLQTLFGLELSSATRWLIAFAILLVLLALFGVFLRRMAGGRLKFKGQGGGRTRQPRLGVVDVHDLDRQRQLILVRRDNVEHLLMIGGASDVVIETNIMRSGARVAVSSAAEPAGERPLALEPLPAPELPRPEAVEEPRRASAPPVPAPAIPVDPVPPPPRAQPAAPAPRPAAQPVPPRPAQAPAAGAPAAAASAAAVSAALTRDAAPAPSASAGELGDMARQLEEALKRPFSAVRPAPAGSRPEPVVPASAPAAAEKPATPPPPAPPVPPVIEAKPQPAAQAPARPALDMEAELEMALGLKPTPARPVEAPIVAPPVFAAPKPQPAPPVFEPVKSEPKRGEPKPVESKTVESKPTGPRPAEPAREEAKAPAAAIEPPLEDKTAKPAPPSFDDVLADTDARDEPLVAPAGPAESKTDAESATAKPADAKSADAKPAEPKKAEPKPAQDDPFSVDAIEAEFARLLGRDPKPKG